jgi:hypothetical protein
MVKQADGQTSRWSNKQMVKQADGQTSRWSNKQMVKQADGQTLVAEKTKQTPRT